MAVWPQEVFASDLVEEASPFMEDMASSVIVETPAVDAVGGTLPAAAMQFADLTESGSESGDEPNSGQEEQQSQPQPQQQPQEQQQQTQQTSSSAAEAAQNTPSTRSSSPPPNCAICLSRCRRKCFTDSCMHQFCFKCLCEWSKIKPECPLCKQPFKTIIHNVRTLDDYDRYPVQSSSTEHSALSFHIVNIRRQRLMLQNQSVMTNNANGDDVDEAASDDSQDGASNAQPSRNHAPYNRFEPYRMELLNFYRNDQDTRGTSGSLSMLWRRYVYDRKLYALPVSDSLTGHFREWSARFYRDNPAQMHRLMPWINRDIVCLLRTSPQNVSQVMHMMHDILPMINIPTRTFRRRLSPFLGERTNHFIHELFNFARSPYDMIGYDRVVQYSALVAEEVEVDLLDLVSTNEGTSPREPDANASANETNGNGNGNVSGSSSASGNSSGSGSGELGSDWSRLPRPSTSVIVTNPSATHSFSVTMATDGSELPGISIRRTTTSNVGSQTVAINLSMRRPANEVIEIDDGDAAANAEVAAINDGSNQTGRRQAGASLPISAHIELQSSDCSNSSDDDDECVFVLERKPPHLRTPELVSLDSNSDSDVVFVDEQKPRTPPDAAEVDSVSFAQDMESAVSNLANELFMGPSTSTGVCSTSGKNWKMVLEEARRQDLMSLRSGRPKRNLTRAQQRALPRAASTSDASGHWSTSSDSSSNSEDSKALAKRRKRRVARKPKTRKRAANNKPATQFKTKRRKRQVSEAVAEEQEEEEQEEEHRQQQESSSGSSSSSSSSSSDESSDDAAVAGDSSNQHNNHSSSSSSDEDSTENLILSTLRDNLKAETVEERKPPKRELDTDEETLQQQPQHQLKATAVKRSRSNSNLSSRSQSNSINSTLASHNTTMSSFSALSIFNSNREDNVATTQPLSMVHAIANSLLELSTLSVGGATGGGAGSGLFNEQSLEANDALQLHADDEDAQLGIYSDASNELHNYQTEAEPELAIDVVGEANSSASIDVNEEHEDEMGNQQDEQQDEQENDEDFEDDEEEEDDGDAAASGAANSDATESDLDATDAY